MTFREILNTIEHRPWQLPKGPWRFYQEWNNAIFLHWQVDPEQLSSFVPRELEIDQYENKAWVSLVAFTMERIRPRHLPSLKPISCFEEINIRTYVRSQNKTGVYFLSIEGGKKASCTVAKGISELPYRFSRISRNETRYHSTNMAMNDRLAIEFSIGKSLAQKNDLDKWLTERYALFQDTPRFINTYEIHHLEWPVHEIALHQLEVHYPRFKDLLKGAPQKAHYSPGVQVLAWGKQRSARGL